MAKVSLSTKDAHDPTERTKGGTPKRRKPGRFTDPVKPKRRKVVSDKRLMEARVVGQLKRKSVTAISAMLMQRPLGEVIYLEGQLAASMRG